MRYLVPIVFFIVGLLRFSGWGECEDGVRVNSTASVCVSSSGGSWVVTNNSPKDVFVPNATQVEFDAFYDKAASLGITVTSMTFTHVAGSVAPVTKTISYGTVNTDLGGTGTKCWITQNLGAARQATSVNDATEASAGWYWQFNKKQGYKHDGTTRTPNTAWITSISESSNWLVANDPCTLLLGSGWRIPTYTEWYNADSGWSIGANAFASILKLHQAGYVAYSPAGALLESGSGGLYYSSTQYSSTWGWYLIFWDDYSGMGHQSKAIGQTLRCLKD